MKSTTIRIHVLLKIWTSLGSHKTKHTPNNNIRKNIYRDMNSLVICSYMGLFLFRPACAVGKTKENQICNCRIWMNSTDIRIHI